VYERKIKNPRLKGSKTGGTALISLKILSQGGKTGEHYQDCPSIGGWNYSISSCKVRFIFKFYFNYVFS